MIKKIMLFSTVLLMGFLVFLINYNEVYAADVPDPRASKYTQGFIQENKFQYYAIEYASNYDVVTLPDDIETRYRMAGFQGNTRPFSTDPNAPLQTASIAYDMQAQDFNTITNTAIPNTLRRFNVFDLIFNDYIEYSTMTLNNQDFINEMSEGWFGDGLYRYKPVPISRAIQIPRNHKIVIKHHGGSLGTNSNFDNPFIVIAANDNIGSADNRFYLPRNYQTVEYQIPTPTNDPNIYRYVWLQIDFTEADEYEFSMSIVPNGFTGIDNLTGYAVAPFYYGYEYQTPGSTNGVSRDLIAVGARDYGYDWHPFNFPIAYFGDISTLNTYVFGLNGYTNSQPPNQNIVALKYKDSVFNKEGPSNVTSRFTYIFHIVNKPFIKWRLYNTGEYKYINANYGYQIHFYPTNETNSNSLPMTFFAYNMSGHKGGIISGNMYGSMEITFTLIDESPIEYPPDVPIPPDGDGQIPDDQGDPYPYWVKYYIPDFDGKLFVFASQYVTEDVRYPTAPSPDLDEYPHLNNYNLVGHYVGRGIYKGKPWKSSDRQSLYKDSSGVVHVEYKYVLKPNVPDNGYPVPPDNPDANNPNANSHLLTQLFSGLGLNSPAGYIFILIVLIIASIFVTAKYNFSIIIPLIVSIAGVMIFTVMGVIPIYVTVVIMLLVVYIFLSIKGRRDTA